MAYALLHYNQKDFKETGNYDEQHLKDGVSISYSAIADVYRKAQ